MKKQTIFCDLCRAEIGKVVGTIRLLQDTQPAKVYADCCEACMQKVRDLITTLITPAKNGIH
jgi:hypothetical protein